MRFARRFIINVMCVLSAVFFLVVVVFWVRSYWRDDELRIEHQRAWVLQSNWGMFEFRALRGYDIGNPVQYTSLPPMAGGYLQFGAPRPVSADLRVTFKSSVNATPQPGASQFLVGRYGRQEVSITQSTVTLASGARAHVWQYQGLIKYGRTVDIPAWMFALASAILPAISVWRFMRNRVRRTGNICIHCGYDLRATPDRCPECGAVPLHAR
jgi:hypothetical protein